MSACKILHETLTSPQHAPQCDHCKWAATTPGMRLWPIPLVFLPEPTLDRVARLAKAASFCIAVRLASLGTGRNASHDHSSTDPSTPVANHSYNQLNV